MLNDADAVVHSMGILLEADYKGVLTGKESIWGGLSRAFSATKGGSQNPLERKEGEPLEPQEKDGQLTYELMNRDTGIAWFLGLVRVVLILQLFSNHTCPRSILPQSPLFRFHFRSGGSTDAAKTIHHHKARCRVHNSLLITQASKHLHETGLPV